MSDYSDVIERGNSPDPLVPEPIALQVIQNMPQASVLLNRARRVPMSSKTLRQPVLSAMPVAYWVNGDTGLKQTTKQQWENLVLTAEELAALVVIPDAYFDDSAIPLWDQVQPLLTEAIGLKIDQAGIFDVDTPASWPDAIMTGATTAGNSVTAGTGDDLGQDVASLGQLMAAEGYAINGFASEPGLNWELVGLRNEQGTPIYQPSLAAGSPSSLYGYPLNEVTNGSWDSTQAKILAADWSKFVIGMRQDITFRIFDEAVITDADGKVIINAMQQDSKIMRVVIRVGFQVANPVNRLEATEADRYPAGFIAPGGS